MLFEPELQLNGRNNKIYKMQAICDHKLYVKETVGELPKLYYFILWKNYSKDKNISEPILINLYLWKIISYFYQNYSKKLIAILLPIANIIAKLLIKLIKQKEDQLSKNLINKWVRASISCFFVLLEFHLSNRTN